MAGKLTDRAIQAAKAQEKNYKIGDGGGLYLEISKKGGKWWRMKYTFEKKENRISLGVYPAVSLLEARRKALAIREQLQKGIDPSAERKAEKAEEKARGLTFEVVAREWYKARQNGWVQRHAKHVTQQLEAYLFPDLGNRPMAELGAKDFLAVLKKIVERGTLETAHRVAQICGQVCRFALINEYIQADPASGLAEALPKPQERHFPAITDPVELGHLLRAIDSFSGFPSTLYALRIVPYVFVRSSELRGAKWEEIDFDKATWTIPAERMKKKRKHIVPLAPQVLALFRELHKITGGGELCFPSPFSRTRCITDVCLLNALRRLGYDRDTMTVHGFRGTASTLLNEQGYKPDVIELQLAHVEKNAVRAAYNHAQYLEERRKMLEEWADYLDTLRKNFV